MLLSPLEHTSGMPPGEYYKTLGASDFWLGQIAFDAGELDKATQEMSRYREDCERWMTGGTRRPACPHGAGLRPVKPWLHRHQARRVERSRQWFQSSLTLKLDVLAKHRTTPTRSMLSRTRGPGSVRSPMCRVG
jgi:hypothetical protein